MSPLIETTAQSIARLSHELATAVAKLTHEAQELIEMNQCNQPQVRAIHALVCEHLRVPKSAMFSVVRTEQYAYARHMAMWLCRELTEHTFADIASWFGGRDHGTVIWAVKAMRARSDTDPRVRAEMEQLLVVARQRITLKVAA